MKDCTMLLRFIHYTAISRREKTALINLGMTAFISLCNIMESDVRKSRLKPSPLKKQKAVLILELYPAPQSVGVMRERP